MCLPWTEVKICASFRAWEQTRKRWLRFCAHAATTSWWKSRRSTWRVSANSPRHSHKGLQICCNLFECVTQKSCADSRGSTHPWKGLCPLVWFAKLELWTLFDHCVWAINIRSSVFKKSLDDDVKGDTSGNFAKLLLALVQVRWWSEAMFNIHGTVTS